MSLDPARARRLREIAGPSGSRKPRAPRPRPLKLEPPAPSQTVTPLPATVRDPFRAQEAAIDEAFERRVCVRCPGCFCAAARVLEPVLDDRGRPTYEPETGRAAARVVALICVWCCSRFDVVDAGVQHVCASRIPLRPLSVRAWELRRTPWVPERDREEVEAA